MGLELILDNKEAADFRKQLQTTSLLNYEERGHHDVPLQVPILVSYTLEEESSLVSPSINANTDPPAPIAGGLYGYTFASYLTITMLWVSEESRTKGIGKALMLKAEEEATRRGCSMSLVNTYSFQAEHFYAKCGYTPYARIPGAFDGQASRIQLFKSLKSALQPLLDVTSFERSIKVSATEPPGLAPLLLAGLDRSTRAINPSLKFDHAPLALRQINNDSSNGSHVSGMYAQTAGSLLIINLIAFREHASEKEVFNQTMEMLVEAERIARERRCNGVIAMAFDFEKGVRHALDTFSMRELHVLPNWLGGAVTRTFMYKSLQ